MKRTLRVTRLHMNQPVVYFGSVLFTLAPVRVVSALIILVLQRLGLDPSSPGYAEGARFNSAVAWALPGFLIYYGVQAISTTFPFGKAIGITRRHYVLGTALANLIMSLYIAVLGVIALALELVTDHWFFGLYVMEIGRAHV